MDTMTLFWTIPALVLLCCAWQLLQVLRMRRYWKKAHTCPLGSYAPRAVVVVPCWEAHPDLERKMRALLEQDYPDYHVVFVTGSEADPAWPVLDRLVRRFSRATLITSGTLASCSQKVHNLLRVLQKTGDAEVYAFADSDADYPPHWLAYLVAPLGDPCVGATTGWFWLEDASLGLWARALAWGSNTQVMPHFVDEHLTCASGATMAIRASVFREAGIADIWRNVVYDDLTLAAAVRRLGLRVRFVPQNVIAVAVAEGSLRWCLAWTRRQMIGVKIYAPHLYWPSLLVALPNLLTILSPVLLLASLFWPGLAGPALLLASALPIRAATGALFCLVVGRPRVARYAFVDYLSVALGLGALLASLFSSRFTWGEVTYELLSPWKTRILEKKR